jgi:hypothetical protein
VEARGGREGEIQRLSGERQDLIGLGDKVPTLADIDVSGDEAAPPLRDSPGPDNYDELKRKFDESLAAETAKHSA